MKTNYILDIKTNKKATGEGGKEMIIKMIRRHKTKLEQLMNGD